MEIEGSLPHSQQPATCPYPKPDQSSSYPSPHTTSRKSILILPYHLRMFDSDNVRMFENEVLKTES